VRVLVVNAGSTSLKLHLVDGAEATAVDEIVAADAVGHRIVHGGEYDAAQLIDDAVEREIERLAVVAPLQNRSALAAIRRVREQLPDTPQVAVFDTTFHRTLPDAAATYAIPRIWRETYGIRRVGFHGLSVQWAASRVRVPRLVVCHLGGGCSVTAVRDGRSVDTTMGFTPLEGVPMATRAGSVDPGALVYILREQLVTLEELEQALEHESGLAGLSDRGDGDIREASPLAVDVFVHRVAGAVAAMAAACGALDALVFTGGIGEHAAEVRERIVERVRFLGDFRVEVVQAREELVVAAAVREVLGAAE
jgi:acetate kinase